jgi:HK97 family phage prohead protease
MTTTRRFIDRRAAPAPQSGESQDEFMDRCTTALIEDGETEDDAERMCEIAWGNGEAFAPAIVKSTTAPVRDMMFTLSDETVDRYGDIVSAAGWELDNFRKNPIALFGHDHDFPIGRWKELHVEGKALRARLDLAPKGTSARIDEIGTLINAGFLRAVSVGFQAKSPPERMKDENGKETGGLRFIRHELLECSVVPVPANPNALAMAKALRISPDTLKLAFAESGDRRELVRRRALTGESARTPPIRHNPMPLDSLDQRIEDEQNLINTLRDRQADHLRNVDDRNPTEADDAITQELSREIGQHVRHLQVLKDAQMALAPGGERQPPEDDDPPPPSRSRALMVSPPRGRAAALAASSQISIQRADGAVRYRSPRAVVVTRRKELDALDYVVRNGVIMLFAHRLRKSPDECRQMLCGDDEMTKAAFDFIQKAATAPAMTTVTGWAAELVTQIQGDFMSPLISTAVFPQLSARGLSLDFGRAGRIAIPTRSRTRTVAGAFIGEGQPIPVKQGLFLTQIITPKKLGVITVMTREIEDHSIPAIEALLRDAISEDTGESIDSVLLDNNPATVQRPPGIRNGITPITPTPSTGDGTVAFNRMVMDIRRLRASLIGDTNDNVRAPCWIMNPIRADAIALTPAPGTGLFPFRDEIRAGSLEGWPLFESTIVDQSQMMAVDAADFVTAGAGAPTFEVSDQATLHMEDTDPQPITGGTPSPAAPTRSLWQTDSFALRLLYRVNWLMRRPMVAYMTGLAW